MSTFLFEFTIALGFVFPLVLYIGHRREIFTEFHLHTYAIGTVLGATWEFGLVLSQTFGIVDSIYTMSVAVRVPNLVHALSHSLWDGALFLVGVFLVQLIFANQRFVTFDWRELCVLILWGQLQSVVVEVVAVTTGLWQYNVTWWNPRIVSIGGGDLTLMPQLIWLLAMSLFYVVCLQLPTR